ncbi:MAG TPA: sigma-54 dependent transcriptional regulator [Candidatus Limnocylindrales bacterium]|nr:sigma-54 dependent transcriptional regulator [Candidatus Limnocylindrales bacterium]
MYSVLIVDDDAALRLILSDFLSQEDYKILLAKDGREALDLMKKQQVDILLLDINMPGMTGMEVLEKVKELGENPLVIMLSALQEVKLAVKAVKLGAYDYLSKPVNLEELKLVIEKGLQHRQLERKAEHLEQKIQESWSTEGLLGTSPAMKRVFQFIDKVARTDTTVLIQGESGTGKELVAYAIHQRSLRKDKPFITIDCGAIPEELVESELFGHEKGAFTGALQKKEGKFELAKGGTLFLDEIGNLPLPGQAKLLRALEQKQITRVGGISMIPVDVRIIAATNVVLSQATREGKFREDLFYRLNVFILELPPLRERKEDIPLLVENFLHRFAQQQRKNIREISPEAMGLLLNYHWPGNVRELRNVLERAIILAEDSIRPEHLPNFPGSIPSPSLSSLSTLPFSEAKDKVLSDLEKEYILQALVKSGGNKAKAARALNINYRTLYEKMKKYGINV